MEIVMCDEDVLVLRQKVLMHEKRRKPFEMKELLNTRKRDWDHGRERRSRKSNLSYACARYLVAKQVIPIKPKKASSEETQRVLFTDTLFETSSRHASPRFQPKHDLCKWIYEKLTTQL